MLRRSALLLTCLFVLSLAIIGCGGGGGGGTANPAGPTASSVETASLSGTVLFDSVPLANASVYLYKSEKAPTIGMTQMPALRSSLIAQQLISDGAYSTTTNGAGVYSFTDVPVGQYTLIAVKDENHQFAQTGVLLGQVTSLDAQLTPTGKIGGRVTAMIGTSEQGAAAVFVYVSGTSYIALTDASGYFVINNVPSNALADSTAYEVAVMPGKGTASPVTGVVVNPGETTNIGTISLSQQTEGYKEIAGRFVAGAGATSADIVDQFVILAAEVDGVLIGTSTDSTGNYSFFVNRLGRYYVMPTEGFLDFAPASQTVTVTALDNTAENLADFVLSHIQTGGSVVAGNVTWPAVTDWTFTEGEIIIEGTTAAGPTFVDRRIISNQSPAPFRFENIPPGSYVLKSNPLRNGYTGATAAFTVTQGVDLTDRSLVTTFIAPIITSTPTTVAASPDQLTIPGNNFGTVAANLLAFVNDKPATIISISNTSLVINIAQVPPGDNVVQLVKILPEGRLPGNKKPFTRPVLAPLAASFTGSSTDTSITYSWQNAPYVNTVEIQLRDDDGIIVRPLQKIIGNSFTYNNLQSNSSYTIEVTSTYPNLPSPTPTAYEFRTKADGINNIPSIQLTGAGIATGTVVGFEVVENTAYVAFDNGSSLTIQSFNLSTNALVNSGSVGISAAGGNLAADSSGVYLTYISTDPMIARFNLTLGTPAATKNLVTDFGFAVPSNATVKCFNGRKFIFVNDNGDVGLRELDSTLGVTATGSVLGVTFHDSAYSSLTNTIYMCVNSAGYFARAFANMDITNSTPPVVGQFSSMGGSDQRITAYGNYIYYRESGSSYTGSTMDARSGFSTPISYSPYSFGVDKLGRMWIYNYPMTGAPYLIQTDIDNSVKQSLKIFNTTYMNSGVSGKLDASTGIMYMLHFNASNQLAVYKYNSNY